MTGKCTACNVLEGGLFIQIGFYTLKSFTQVCQKNGDGSFLKLPI